MRRTVLTSFWILLGIGLLIGNFYVYRVIFAPRVLTVSVFDVGEGSAVFVQSPREGTALIDAGPDASILRALGLALPPWRRSIDAVILTGTKSTFVGGLPDVEHRYHVSNVLHIGDERLPYGTTFSFGTARIHIIAPGALSVSYGVTSLTISSSTPKSVYLLNGTDDTIK